MPKHTAKKLGHLCPRFPLQTAYSATDTIVTITTRSKKKIGSNGNKWCSIGMNQIMTNITILLGTGKTKHC